MWYLTGTQAHANKAITIIDSWSSTVQSVDPNCEIQLLPMTDHGPVLTFQISPDLDMQLASSLGPFLMTNAAEIIRYTSAGWTPTGIRNFENMLTDVFYPRLNGENC